jgi:hypothetical protein
MYPENKKKLKFFPFSFFSVFLENLFFQGWRKMYAQKKCVAPVGSEGVTQAVSKPFLVYFQLPALFLRLERGCGHGMAAAAACG